MTWLFLIFNAFANSTYDISPSNVSASASDGLVSFSLIIFPMFVSSFILHRHIVFYKFSLGSIIHL